MNTETTNRTAKSTAKSKAKRTAAPGGAAGRGLGLAAVICIAGICKAEDIPPPPLGTAPPAPPAPLYSLQGSVASNRAVRENEQARAAAKARELNALRQAMAVQATAGRPSATTAAEYIALNPPPPPAPRPADGAPRSTPSVPLAQPGIPAFDLSRGEPARGVAGGGRPGLFSGRREAGAAPSFSGVELPGRAGGERRGLRFPPIFERGGDRESALPPAGAASYELPPPPSSPPADDGAGQGIGAVPERGPSGLAVPEPPAFDAPPVGAAPGTAGSDRPAAPPTPPSGAGMAEGVAPAADSDFVPAPPEAGEERGGFLSLLRPREREGEVPAFLRGGGVVGMLAGRQGEARPGAADPGGGAASGVEPIFVGRPGAAEEGGEWSRLAEGGRVETGGVLVSLHPGNEVRVIEELGGGRVRVRLRDGRVGDLDRALLAP